MFLAHPPGQPPRPVRDERDSELAGWLDLIEPTDAECDLATKLTDLRIPTRAQLEEIENSSRLMMEGNVFYLSTPLLRRLDDDVSLVTPIGFVLSPDRLLTIRYTDFKTFETVAARVSSQSGGCGADAILIMLIEAMIDRLADTLERIGFELDTLSKRIFQVSNVERNNADKALRNLLRQVGRTADLLSDVRESLLGLGRITLYVGEHAPVSAHASLNTQLATIGRDISSLNDYIAQVNNKVQFLLDATLGFINIEQNNGIRLLTVVSFIGVPPTLIASIYGMNFKNIPELNWNYGYFYALGMMALTVAGPLLVFWRKGWLGGR
jgi:magnesium transporter